MFNINVMEKEKIFSVLIRGNIEQNYIKKFIEQLKCTINGINTENYSLVVEIKDVEIRSINTMISLSQIMSIYKKTDFKNIFAIVNDDLKSIKQAEILKKYVGKDIIQVNSIDEVIKNLRQL